MFLSLLKIEMLSCYSSLERGTLDFPKYKNGVESVFKQTQLAGTCESFNDLAKTLPIDY